MGLVALRRCTMEFDFSKSNDPWIINGTVILFNYIDEKSDELKECINNNKIKCDYDNLKICCPDVNNLKNFLECIVNMVQENNYITKKNKGLVIENDELKAFDRLNKSPLTNYFFKGINPIAGKDININSVNDKIKLQYEEFKKMQKNIKIKDSKSKLNLFSINNFKNGQRCDFCNQKILSDSIKASYYPFTASLEKYKNFNSNFKRKGKICILCAVSSFMVYYRLPFLISDGFLFFAFPVINAKSESRKIWKILETQTGVSIFSEYSNFAEHGDNDPFRSFILLIEYIYSKIEKNIKPEITDNKNDIAKQWKKLSWVIGYSTTKIIRNLYTYNETEKLFRLVNILKSKNIILSDLINKFKININGNYNHFYEKEISRKILFFEDLNRDIELFYGDYIKSKKEYIKRLNDFLFIYNKEVLNMDEKLIKTCYYIGKTIGEYCRGDETKPEDKDTLYALRSCTNLGQFLQFLDEATFKIKNLNIPMTFLGQMDSKNWQDVKSLISIFAHQAFFGSNKIESNREVN